MPFSLSRPKTSSAETWTSNDLGDFHSRQRGKFEQLSLNIENVKVEKLISVKNLSVRAPIALPVKMSGELGAKSSETRSSLAVQPEVEFAITGNKVVLRQSVTHSRWAHRNLIALSI